MPSPVSLAVACTPIRCLVSLVIRLWMETSATFHQCMPVLLSSMLGFWIKDFILHRWSYELRIGQTTFGHYYRFVKNICLLSNTEALVDYISPKKGKVELKFFNLFTRMLTAPVDDVETSMFVTCMPIIQAPAAVVHDFVMMTNEYLAPNGLILACDIIGNGEFQQPKY